MLFNSVQFAVFFVLVYCLYWAMHRRFRAQNLLLLSASFVFYGWWDVRFLFLFLLTTIVDFYCALMIGRGSTSARQRASASLCLIASAFLCLIVQWKAIRIGHVGIAPWAVIDWRHLISTRPLGWGVLAATVAVAVVVTLCEPRFRLIDQHRRRRLFITASLISNLAILGFFKYFNFFATSFAGAVHSVFGVTPSAWTLNVVLPVGISFYTFQSLAYTIDVYRGKLAPVSSYFNLASCLSFFPLLVAGPIERPNHLFPQFFRPRTVSATSFREGCWLIVWGLFKKVVVADNMATIVAAVFGPYDGSSPSHLVPHDGLRLLLGVYAFAVQIYGDFSGYTDIARGTAKLLGFDIMLNFNLPYFAISPADFWKRWHISLSTWLRDYLYIPLGGNRHGKWPTYRNLLLTMLLGGLWHGAAWTFVISGAYHGVLLIAYRAFAPNLGEEKPASLPTKSFDTAPVTVYSMPLPIPLDSVFLGRITCLLLGLLMFHLTCIGWLFFRAQNLTTVGIFLRGIFASPHWSPEASTLAHNLVFYSWFLLLFQIAQATTGTLNPMPRFPWFIRLNIWLFLLMSLLAFAARGEHSFIYFAF